MWTHPLGQDSGDFDVEDIVDAREDFGADTGDYAKYVEVGGDFGTLGLSYGEDDTMGRSFRRRFKSITRHIAPKAIISPISKVASKAVTAPLSMTRKVVPRRIGGMKMGFLKRPLGKVESKMQTALAHKKDMGLRKLTGSTTSNSITSVPTTQPPLEVMLVPQVHSNYDQVAVSSGGQLTEQKLTRGMSASAPRSQFAHPLLYSGMGEVPEGMGAFSLSSLTSSLKAKAAEELAKLKAKMAADAKARLAQATSNISSSLFNKPEVQAVLAEQAKGAAANTLAEKFLDPTFQKKAGIGVGVAALAGLALAYAAFKNK